MQVGEVAERAKEGKRREESEEVDGKVAMLSQVSDRIDQVLDH